MMSMFHHVAVSFQSLYIGNPVRLRVRQTACDPQADQAELDRLVEEEVRMVSRVICQRIVRVAA